MLAPAFWQPRITVDKPLDIIKLTKLTAVAVSVVGCWFLHVTTTAAASAKARTVARTGPPQKPVAPALALAEHAVPAAGAPDVAPLPEGMVLIPAGSFIMGDTIGGGWVNECPTHRVTLAAFYLEQNEVTKARWDEVYAWALGHGYRFDDPGRGKAPNHPVQTVNWYDVVKWCNARSEHEGRVPAYYTNAARTTVYRTGRVDVQANWVNWTAGYRLPTEAEWERAARGGARGRRFPWGDTISQTQANYDSSSYYRYDVSPSRGFDPLYRVGEFPYTSPVGSFAPNGYGLYDLIGNVWEWCWDWYGDYSNKAQTDPRGPASGPGRLVRGGSWNTYAWYCRLANRDYYRPALRDYDYGFRCVLPADQPAASANRR